MPALWLTSPRDGTQLPSGPLVIEGTVKSDASAPMLRISNEDGDVVSSTSAQTATEPNADGWRPWSVTVSLSPGKYSLEALTTAGGADGRGRSVSENKTVSVS